MTDFIQFASGHGLIIKSLPFGVVTRCQTESHRSKRNGAFFFDGEWGWLQNWELHDTPIIWKSNKVTNHIELQERIKKSTQKYNQERIKANADAAKKAHWILNQCELNLSAYLGRKGFPEMSANMWIKDQERPLLVIPMHKESNVVGCQLIDHEGNKKFLKGQVTQDASFQIGNGKQAFFVEGYVSGLSLQIILQSLKISYRIFVTFSAGNLLRFAKRIDGFVIADNDASKTGEKAAIESGRRYWMPPAIGYDINDHYLQYGAFKTTQEIRKLIYTKSHS